MKALFPLAVMAVALGGCADNTPGGKAAHQRHENMEEIGAAFKTISNQVKSGSPDMSKVQPAADKIAGMAPKVPDWFPAGSGPQDGKKTDALEAAWTKPDELRAAADKFAAAATELAAAADNHDVAALGTKVRKVGGTCKSCHDKFMKD